MYNTYLLIAKAILNQGLRIAAAKWGLAFLGGPIGSIIGFFVAPVLAVLITEGMLQVEFAKLDFQTSADRKRYQKAIDKAMNAKGKLTPAQKKAFMIEIKKATKDFISIKKYINS